MKNLFILIAIGVVLLTGCHSSSQGPVTLKFGAAKGTKFTYTETTDMTLTQAIMGNDVKVTTAITFGYVFEVVNDSAGLKTVQVTLAKIQLNASANGQDMKFDSDNPGTDTTGLMGSTGLVFASLKGGQFSFTINDYGDVGQVTGLKEMLQERLGKINGPGNISASQGMDNTFNEQTFRETLQQAFAVYPGKPVNEGDSWTKATSLNISGSGAKLDNTYTLASFDGKVAKINVVSKISPGQSGAPQGVQIEMTGEAKGTNSIDVATGIPLNGDNNITLDAKAAMAGQQMAMKATVKITVTGQKM